MTAFFVTISIDTKPRSNVRIDPPLDRETLARVVEN